MPDKLPNTENPQRGHNLALDGLRGFAALSIFLLHLATATMASKMLQASPTGRVGDVLASLGQYIVCVFFCISGFLIVQSLIRHKSVARFARNRVARIYPVFAILMVVVFTIDIVTRHGGFGDLRGHPTQLALHFLSNFFFLPGIFFIPIAQKVAWSLSYEAAFYIVAALLYMAYAANQRKLPGIAINLSIGSTSKPPPLPSVASQSRLVGREVGESEERRRTGREGESETGKVPKFMAVRVPAVLWGIVGSAAGTSLLVSSPLSSYFVVGVFCYAFRDRLAKVSVPIPSILGPACLLVGFAVYCVYVLLALPFLLILFATVVTKKGWASSVLALKFFTYLGRISYSLYLVHTLCIDTVRAIAEKVSGRIGDQLALAFLVLAGTILTIAVAHYSYEFVEIRLTNKLFPKRAKEVPA